VSSFPQIFGHLKHASSFVGTPLFCHFGKFVFFSLPGWFFIRNPALGVYPPYLSVSFVFGVLAPFLSPPLDFLEGTTPGPFPFRASTHGPLFPFLLLSRNNSPIPLQHIKFPCQSLHFSPKAPKSGAPPPSFPQEHHLTLPHTGFLKIPLQQAPSNNCSGLSSRAWTFSLCPLSPSPLLVVTYFLEHGLTASKKLAPCLGPHVL